jgi:hypothetical protein
MSHEIIKWTDDPWDYKEAKDWAYDNCPSWQTFNFIDMSDISSWDGPADTGYEFSFLDEQDAVLFSLKWL